VKNFLNSGRNNMNKAIWKVLIIDDEEGIQKVLSNTLTDSGYQVLTAADGEGGILLYHEVSPQIVDTDIRLPDIDGIIACDNHESYQWRNQRIYFNSSGLKKHQDLLENAPGKIVFSAASRAFTVD